MLRGPGGRGGDPGRRVLLPFRRGIWRWLSLAVFVLAPIAVIVLYAFGICCGWRSCRPPLAARRRGRALGAGREPSGLADARVSGGAACPAPVPDHESEVQRRESREVRPETQGGRPRRRGIFIGGPEPVDVAQVAREAVARGADLLGIAGGDGTQALVAGVAAEHGLPFMVISAGTRNHFALDLGLDREDPSACLGALSDGVELRVDLGMINGQVFVNNASFGAYAEVVETPAYRGDKLKTTLDLLPGLLQGQRGARLSHRRTARRPRKSPQALLVANNPYGTGDVAGLAPPRPAGSRRARRGRRQGPAAPGRLSTCSAVGMQPD